MSHFSLRFAHDRFAEYYQKYSSIIQPPASIERREFGFLLLKERVMLRHKGFRSVDALRSFLKTIVPSDVYYSSAYYERPEEEMRRKCPSCGEQKVDGKTWPCEVCLESAKAETMKLIDVLTRDFGFFSEELKVAFSGHRRYVRAHRTRKFAFTHFKGNRLRQRDWWEMKK